jgi:hypothetical protein
VTSPDDRRRSQLYREQELFRETEGQLREGIASMEGAVRRWQEAPTPENLDFARAAVGLIVQDEMARFVRHAQNVATTGDGFLEPEVTARMWRAVANLTHEHMNGLLYFHQLHTSPDQATATPPPFRTDVLDRIVADWPRP